MRLLLCGGGTAGHVNPALAVAEEMKKELPGTEILFVGRKSGIENEMITKAGFDLKTINIQGIRRSLSPKNIKIIFNAIKSVECAKEIIREFCPDVILGTGGYVCWPVITAGKKLGIPTAIHESNITPGLTTRLLSKKSDIVMLNNEETKKNLPKSAKTITVGNPLRKSFKKTTRQDARRKLGVKSEEVMILSFGGSIGAEKINNVMLEVMKSYSSKQNDIKHFHAVGNRYYDKDSLGKSNYKNCKILPFIDDMPTYLNAADIVICRCGAMTLSEIAEVGVASILIPSPNVTENHQLINGKKLEKEGAAILIEEKNLTQNLLIDTLKTLKNDENGRKTRAKIIKGLSTPNSAKHIVNELFLLKNGNKRAVF